jgi:polyhydroxyalkanoate synthesis regulator phasin
MPKGQYERKPRASNGGDERLRLINDCFESQGTINRALEDSIQALNVDLVVHRKVIQELEERIAGLERRLETANVHFQQGYAPHSV